MSGEDVYRLLKERAAKTPKGSWVIAQGFNPMLVHDIDVPTRQSLDAVSTQHPIIVMAQNLHVVCNSLLLSVYLLYVSFPGCSHESHINTGSSSFRKDGE